MRDTLIWTGPATIDDKGPPKLKISILAAEKWGARSVEFEVHISNDAHSFSDK